MTTQAPVFRDDHCANCQEPLPETVDSLYCSELCDQTASTIRWWRRKIRAGEDDRPDIVETLQTRIAHILGGGYRGRARTIPSATRELVIARDDSKCVQCGAPGTEIDHVDGDSNDPSNLQLLCHPCHHEKTATHFIPASETGREVVAQLALRAVALVPLYVCDDDETWERRWRVLKRERRERLLARLTDAGIDVSVFRARAPRTELVVALEDALVDPPRVPAPEDYDGESGLHPWFAKAMQRDD